MADNLWHELAAAAAGGAFSVALATLGVALAAMFVGAVFASAIARRTAWQVAVIATLGFVLLELSGVGAASLAVVESVAARPSLAATQAESHDGDDFHRSADVPLPMPSPTLLPRDVDNEIVPSDDDWNALADAWIATRIESESASESEIVEPIAEANAAPFAESERGGIAASPRWLPVALAAVWLGGGLWFLARLTLASRAMRALAGRLPLYVDGMERDDAETKSDVRELAAAWGFVGSVRLVALPEGASPIAFGLWRPTIGLPGDFERRFTRPQRRAVLAHELAHLAAGDPQWRLLCDVLTAVLWWHPAAWLMRRRLIEASEAAADDASRALPAGAEQLAEALVVLGKRMSRRRGVAAFGAEGEFRSSLARRVERLLTECDEPWRPVSRGRLLAIRGACGVAAVVFVLCVAYWGRTQLSSTQGESEMRTFAQTWRQSLCGVALAMLASGPATADESAKGVAAADADVYSAFVAFDDEDEEEGEREGREREGDEEPERAERREREERREVHEVHENHDGREGHERHEIHEHRERGDGHERHEIHEIHERHEAEHDEGERREGDREEAEHDEARRREAQEVENRIRRIRGRLAELGDRESDERHELAREAERLMHELRELAGEDRERRERDREGAERNEARRREAQEVENRVREIRNRIRELGDREPEARRELAGEAERLMRHLRELAGGERDRPERDRPRDDRPDGPRREQLEHLRAAIEHLRAAGMHDLAERLAREHEERNRRREGGDRPRPDRPRPDRPRPDQPRPDRPESDRPRPERPQPDRPRPERDRPERDRLERPEGERREGDRPRPERPEFDRRESDRREGDEGREASRQAAEALRNALFDQQRANELLRQQLDEAAKAFAERAAVAQAEDQARRAALEQLQAVRALEHANLRDVAEAQAAKLAEVQDSLRAQMAELQARVEDLRNELSAKEVELDRARELIERKEAQ